MRFDPQTGTITWRIHLASPPEAVFRAIATDAGRASFWAEAASENNGAVTFQFPNGVTWTGRILNRVEPVEFAIDYFGSRAEFRLQPDGDGGTDLTLIDRGVSDTDRTETIAGWVSVLMALKAAVDHEIDLRNHDPARSWDQGYADN